MDFTWAFEKIGGPAALALSSAAGNGNPVVAVLDNDCARLEELRDHPENLNVLELLDLFDAHPGGSPARSGSHGLGCASLIGGIRGTAPGTLLRIAGVPAQANRQAAYLRWTTGISESYRFAQDLDLPSAEIVSISLVLQDHDDLVSTFADCLRRGRAGLGAVLVLAAGNSAMNAAQPIARHGFCITVGASCLDSHGDEHVADYSNHGRHVDIYAPSGASFGRRYRSFFDKILAAALPFGEVGPWFEDDLLRPPAGSLPEELRSFYSLEAGTSTATALCSGTIALMLRANPGLTALQVKNILMSTAARIHSKNDRRIFLRLDAAAAVARALRS